MWKPLWKPFGWSSPVSLTGNRPKQLYFRGIALYWELLCAHFDTKIGFFRPGWTGVIRGSQIGFKYNDRLTDVGARAILVRVIQNLVVVSKCQYFFPDLEARSGPSFRLWLVFLWFFGLVGSVNAKSQFSSHKNPHFPHLGALYGQTKLKVQKRRSPTL